MYRDLFGWASTGILGCFAIYCLPMGRMLWSKVRKTPLTNPCRNSGIRSKNFSIGRENQSTRIEALSKLTELFKYCRLWKWRVRLSRASRYCFSYLAGKCSSNHCGNCWRKSCSLLSSSRMTCGAQCAGNQIIKESAGQWPPITSATHAVSAAGTRVLARLGLATIFTSPLHGRFLSPSPLTLCPEAACSSSW